MWRFSPRSEEAEPYIRLSKLGDVLYWKDEPLESLALEASGANFGRARELWESIETTLLKGTYKIQHTLGPRAETII